MPFTRHKAPRIAAITVCCLAVIAGILYATGIYDRWRDTLSLGDACAGTLADGDDLSSSLGSDNNRASEEGSADGGELTSCRVVNRDGDNDKLTVDIRWSKDAGRSQAVEVPLPLPPTGRNPVAPLKHGWPGVISQDGSTARVTLAMRCRNRSDSLLVDSLLHRAEKTNTEKARSAFARFTTAAATRAADHYGCDAEGGSRIADVPSDGLSTHPTPLAKAKGTCRALRPYAARAAAADVPMALETPTADDAPMEDCFLGPSDQDESPGYRFVALYGPYSTMMRSEPGEESVHSDSGTSQENHRAWATAQCPGSPDRARFIVWGVADSDVFDTPVSKSSTDFEADTVTAFAKESAQRHGCTDLRLP